MNYCFGKAICPLSRACFLITMHAIVKMYPKAKGTNLLSHHFIAEILDDSIQQ